MRKFHPTLFDVIIFVRFVSVERGLMEQTFVKAIILIAVNESFLKHLVNYDSAHSSSTRPFNIHDSAQKK